MRYDALPLSKEFTVKWTPTHIILDTKGKEHSRNVGFVPPGEMIPLLILGMAKTCCDLDDLDQAIADFDQIIETFPRTHSAPEAVYLRGVSRYLATHHPKHLIEIYEQMQAQYPQSVWAHRCSPYRLLGPVKPARPPLHQEAKWV